MDLPLKKLNWLLLIRSISCQNLIILSKTIFSPILQAIEERKIGRQFSLEDLEPFLCKGVISAFFYSSGRRPTEDDLFTIYVNEGANSGAHDFKMHGAIWSGPGDLLGLSF